MPTMILTEQDVKVAPFDSLIHSPPRCKSRHQGGPIWNDWNNRISERHCRNRRPIDSLPSLDGFSADTPCLFKAFWCGPITRHFGHQIAEFCTRIPLYLGKHSKDAPLIFCIIRGSSTNDIPVFMRQILDWYQIPDSHVQYCSTPVIIERLEWAPQQEQLQDIPATSDYLDILTRHAGKNQMYDASVKRSYYISRTGQSKGLIAGERYLEEFFRANGFSVVKPELHTVQEQLTIYQTADRLVFSEGSAVHALQLLGYLKCKVMIIARRRHRFLAKNILTQRVSELHHSDCIRDFIPGVTADGQTWEPSGITLLDPHRLIEEVEKIGISGRRWNHAQFRSDEAISFKEWTTRMESIAGECFTERS